MRNRVKRVFKQTWRVGLVVGAVYSLWHWYRSKASTSEERGPWDPQPFPYPPVPHGTGEVDDAHPQVHPPGETRPQAGPEADGRIPTAVGCIEPVDGACPASHPVKGKLASGIYHEPGGASYARTKPDRCYLDAQSAEADGLRPAKR